MTTDPTACQTETAGRLAAEVSRVLPPVADWMRGGQAPLLSRRVLLLGNRFATSSEAGTQQTFPPVERRLHRLTTALPCLCFLLSGRSAREQHELSQVLLPVPVFLLEVSVGRSQKRKESLCGKCNLEPLTLGRQSVLGL